jgi:hypothetical protein
MNHGPDQAGVEASCRFRFLTTEYLHAYEWVFLVIEEIMKAKGIPSISNPQSPVDKLLTRVLTKLRLVRNFRRSPRGPVFVPFMGYSEYKTVPFAYWSEIVPYCFDCWEPKWPRWESFFRRHRTRLAFFTALQSADYFKRALPSMTSVWLPEALAHSECKPDRPLDNREIDVLEFGRRYENFHNAITRGLEIAGRIHKYERVPGELIFKSDAEFTAALGNSKMVVAFPSSVTHPERSGNVETLTQRYLESIASKCVVVGKCPSELVKLFGYNPVIEIVPDTQLNQVNAILSQIAKYQPLVERNYTRLLETGTWKSRFQTILEHMNLLAPDTKELAKT